MAGKLSFSIAINLLTENFKRGTSSVKNGLRSMQMQVLTFAAALGAGGIGLTDFVTRLIDVARETSRVTTALKNVSGGMGQFADNQRFLLDMAKKYGLEINALTGNFAKFTAASQVSGMSMDNQKKIFESVSRACTAFGMSADDSNGVFLALSQMMSKGKISSEELRLQMGERLPIALQAMAKAAGVPISELDKLMKQGKLMSKDVLPGFADALNEMIPNVDTDNIETSVNRLKNAFTEFTNGTGVQNAYKGIIDWLTGAVDGLQGKISSAITFIIALISGKLLASVVSYFGQFWKLIDTTISKSKTAEAQKLLLTQQRIEAEKAYESTLTSFNTTENGKRLASKSQLNKAEKVMDSAKAAEKKAMLAAETAAEKAAAVSSSSVWGKTMNTLKLGLTQLGRTLKGVFAAAWPLMLITAISTAIAKFKEMYDEAKRIKSIFSDYKKEAESVGNTTEISTLNAQLQIMNDKKRSLDDINNAQAQLQKMLGVEHKSQEDLNKLVAKRVKLLENTAKADYYTRKKIEAQEQYNGLNDKHSKLKAKTLNGGFFTRLWNGTEVGDTRKEMDELLRIIADSSREITKATVDTNKLSTIDPPGGNPDDKKTALQKAEEKYAQSLRELDAQKEIEKMTDAEYFKAVDELGRKMLIEAKASGDKDILNSEYIKMLEDVIDHPLYNETQAELEKVQKEYTDAVELAKTKLDKKLISEDDYRAAIIDAATSAADSAISIKDIGDAADGFIKKVQGIAISYIKAPVLGKRDSAFDYKANDTDKISGELDVWKKYKDELEDLKSKHKGLSQDLQNKLNGAIRNVDSLEDALKLSEIQEDIKQMSQDLDNGIYSGIKDSMSVIDSLVSSYQRLEEAFDPKSEASEWEKLMAVWSAMTNAVDSFLSIAKTMESLAEITDKLTKARASETQEIQKSMGTKVAEATVDTTVTGTKVANSGIKIAADNAEKNAVVANAGTEVVANTAKAGSAAAASVAGIPIVGLALAAAAVATIIGIFASLPKFATGGIVGGNSPSGDKILARLNSGELILNKGQQSKLSDAIDSQRSGSSGGVVVSGTSRVKGDDIYLSLSNHVKRTGKKSPWK